MRKNTLLIFLSIFLISIFISGTVIAESINTKEENVGFFAKIKNFFKKLFILNINKEKTDSNKLPIEKDFSEIPSTPIIENIEASRTDCGLPPECERAREINSLYSLYINNTIEDEIPMTTSELYRPFELTLDAVDENSALLTLDGVADSIDVNEKERVNGVDLYVCDVNAQQNWAVIAACDAQSRTYLCLEEETFSLRVGEYKTIRDYTITLLGINLPSALIQVDGEVDGVTDSINEGETRRVGGLEIHILNIFDSDDDKNDRAILVVGC